ncbi:MAG: ATP-binding cassette domain-containing protein [Ruminococcaceae bacterium]|nr:ATP-binding cassette domain-containing protein [Oscillospiraceae bacterium]
MEQIVCKGLNFTYSTAKEKALDGIDITIKKGEFVVVCGRSGCGKTTFLRHLKKSVAPAGEKTGEVLFCGQHVSEMNDRDAACKTGFVMQDPENQIVTDKVWHELAFGLENIGTDTATIRLRTAEIAAYFGIKDWFDEKTAYLSGGQKQLLNLASVMIMNPELIILDEPTSQLDPVAAGNFLATVSKINRELGVTVIMTEHRLEEAFGYADRVVVMDKGKIVFDKSPRELSECMGTFDDFVRLAMPASVRIHAAVSGSGKSPVTVNEGAEWLSSIFENKPKITRVDVHEFNGYGSAVEIKNLFFRYDKNGKDILNNLSLTVPKGSVFAIMGGNGAGKSTLLKILCGALKPISGKIKILGEDAKKSKANIFALPQNTQTLFAAKTVFAELEEMCTDREKISKIAELTRISHLFERHPYDLSGGEQQRTALAKLLLKDPDILLLDEPTKGMDCEFKQTFADILNELKRRGKTIIMVSHDIEFCAANADFCSMIFDAVSVCTKDANSFFAGNLFYTTSANRMSKHVFENCVTDKDVILLCQKNIQQ